MAHGDTRMWTVETRCGIDDVFVFEGALTDDEVYQLTVQ